MNSHRCQVCRRFVQARTCSWSSWAYQAKPLFVRGRDFILRLRLSNGRSENVLLDAQQACACGIDQVCDCYGDSAACHTVVYQWEGPSGCRCWAQICCSKMHNSCFDSIIGFWLFMMWEMCLTKGTTHYETHLFLRALLPTLKITALIAWDWYIMIYIIYLHENHKSQVNSCGQIFHKSPVNSCRQIFHKSQVNVGKYIYIYIYIFIYIYNRPMDGLRTGYSHLSHGCFFVKVQAPRASLGTNQGPVDQLVATWNVKVVVVMGSGYSTGGVRGWTATKGIFYKQFFGVALVLLVPQI